MRAAARTARALLLGLVVVLLALTGCVSVPTSGPVEKVEGSQPDCQNCVNVEVATPAAGDEPRQIVEDFLRANYNYQPNYSVAKQYLTRSAAEKWSSEEGASIYTGAPEARGDTVVLRGRVVGSLDRDRTFTARDQELTYDFGVVKEDGQWRISNPPGGLMVAKFAFDQFYQRYNLYFIGNGDSLVPDSIYLPDLRNPANVASAMVKALLDGPSRWLAPAVSTAVPQDTTLSVDSVTIADGIASVPLSEQVLQLPDAQRTLLAAQLVYTLKQVPVVKQVQLLVNSQPFRVPGIGSDGLVAVESVSRELDPVPFVTAEQPYAVRSGAVAFVTGTETPELQDLPGQSAQRYQVDSLAVSVANTDLALVTDDRSVLRRRLTTSDEGRVVLRGVGKLLRPQFSRTGEIWAVGDQGGRQRMWVATADGTREVTAPVLGEGRVVAFRLSPDGSRLALLVRQGRRTVLGLARILRSDETTVEGWRELDTRSGVAAPTFTELRDVAWLDATNLMVLAAATPSSPFAPVTVSDDASRIETDPESNDWDAAELTVLLRTQTAIVVTRDGVAYRDDGSQWREYLTGVSTIAYPG